LPFVTVNDVRLYYRLEGKPGAPLFMLSHSIGADHGMWAPQVGALLPYFQILRYDTRGHGASDAPRGDYSIETLARDALGIADALEVGKFAFCGLSLGGMIGQWLGMHASDRLSALVLANTSPMLGPASNWDTRKKLVLEGGMAAIVDMAMQRFFSPAAWVSEDAHAHSVKNVLLSTNPIGYAGCCMAIREMDHTAGLRKIRVPTLIIAGDRDVSTPWEGHGEILEREIPGARSVRLPAAHLSNIERPHSFNLALLDFLLSPQECADPLTAGFDKRRAVLGEAYVDAAMSAANDFTRDFQELITRYAWGTIWTRPGLPRRVRRLLVLAIAATQGRWEEFRLHLRSGLEHELEPCDVKEALLQTAIYAGVPAANTGFAVSREELQRAGQS
jgi:3-oxoadipate enol-lactonase / 4-carboxymuconolactone decarboxylase